MNTEVLNALRSYFETLYDMNRNIITLCGVSGFDYFAQYTKTINDMVSAIPRLVPYRYNRSEKKYVVSTDGGLLEYESEIPFLKKDYQYLLDHHYDFLCKAIKIRNKLEHKMHAAELKAIGSGNMILFEFEYSIGGKKCQIYAGEIISFIKNLNLMFSRIQELVDRYAHERGEADYAYCIRLLRFNFCEFNKIYESDILRIVGKTLLSF